jgi:hypothetical protein
MVSKGINRVLPDRHPTPRDNLSYTPKLQSVSRLTNHLLDVMKLFKRSE